MAGLCAGLVGTAPLRPSEDLLGWHVNHGKETAPDFFPASQFRDVYYRPDIVSRMLTTLDEASAIRLANEERGGKTQTTEIAKLLPPVVEINSRMVMGGFSPR